MDTGGAMKVAFELAIHCILSTIKIKLWKYLGSNPCTAEEVLKPPQKPIYNTELNCASLLFGHYGFFLAELCARI